MLSVSCFSVSAFELQLRRRVIAQRPARSMRRRKRGKLHRCPLGNKPSSHRCLRVGVSQFLSRCSVPKEQSKIARHFNAGKGLEKASPPGTAEKKRRFQPSLRDGLPISSDPGVQTPGCFSRRGGIPAGRSVFSCPNN